MRKTTKWKETIKAIFLYPFILNKVRAIESDIIFFFPRYQTGGAERVHINIMKTVAGKNPTCIITDLSADDDFKDEFAKVSTLIYLHRWGWKTSFRKAMAKKIALQINKINNPIIFGSNTEFFYDLFPHLKNDCVKIDLLHTDLSHLPLSIENYAAPYTHQLNRRIVLGEGHKAKLLDFYAKKNIDLAQLSKVEIIPNGIPVPDVATSKDYSDQLSVLFVARNGYEKRPELFLDIASEAAALGLPYKFIMIGDFEGYSSSKTDNVEIIGKITDPKRLATYYKKSHFIFITSLFEGFPMVLLEGMSYGLIPISTDVGEIRYDVNETKGTGFIIPNDPDTQRIVQKFIEIMQKIDKNRSNLPITSANCYQLVNTKFSQTYFEQHYRQILTNAL